MSEVIFGARESVLGRVLREPAEGFLHFSLPTDFSKDTLELDQINKKALINLTVDPSGVGRFLGTVQHLMGLLDGSKDQLHSVIEKLELAHEAGAGDSQRLVRLKTTGGAEALQILLGSHQKLLGTLSSLGLPLKSVQGRMELIQAEVGQENLPSLRIMDKGQEHSEQLDAEANFIGAIHAAADAQVELAGAKLAEIKDPSSDVLKTAREKAEKTLESAKQLVSAASTRLMPVINQSISVLSALLQQVTVNPPQTSAQTAATINNLTQQLALLEALMSTPSAAQDPKIAAQIKALQKKIAELKALQNTQKPDKVEASVFAQLSERRRG